MAAHPERAQAMLQEIVPQVETVDSRSGIRAAASTPRLLTDAGPAAAFAAFTATGLPIETWV